jgi:hypothetical protein
VTVPERIRKRTTRWFPLKTDEIAFKFLCLTEKLKPEFGPFEVIWALHSCLNLINLPPVFVFHEFFLSGRTVRWCLENPSPADRRHLFHAFLDKVIRTGDLVLFWFPGDRPPDEFLQLPVGASRPEGALEVRFVI